MYASLKEKHWHDWEFGMFSKQFLYIPEGNLYDLGKKKNPLAKPVIGYSGVISGLYKIEAYEGILSIDYPIYSPLNKGINVLFYF